MSDLRVYFSHFISKGRECKARPSSSPRRSIASITFKRLCFYAPFVHYQPLAGKQRDHCELESRIHALKLDSEIVYTTHAGHARQLAREAGERGQSTRLYACGGDGTLNEVVNGAAGWSNLAVTNVPMGTGNDFLKIFGPDYLHGFSDLAALSRWARRQTLT